MKLKPIIALVLIVFGCGQHGLAHFKTTPGSPIQISDDAKLSYKMKPVVPENLGSKQYVLGKKGIGYIIFCESGNVKIDLSDDKSNYQLKWINPSTGEILKSEIQLTGGTVSSNKAPFEGAIVAWILKK